MTQSFPSSNHVFVIMLENQDFSEVFPAGRATNCSSSGMPYLCSLAAKNGTALNFYSNAHGSLLAYLYNTSGADWTGSPSDCTGSGCAHAGAITTTGSRHECREHGVGILKECHPEATWEEILTTM